MTEEVADPQVTEKEVADPRATEKEVAMEKAADQGRRRSKRST
jgi:hypothetical protein